MGKEESVYSSLSEFSEIYVSELDLVDEVCKRVILESIKEGKLKEDYTTEDVLYEIWGLNTDLEYESISVEHKTRFGKIHKGVRYVGFERYDEEWLQSPLCSIEMKKRTDAIKARKYYERW